MVPMERVKYFHDFYGWKFKYASVNLDLFAISIYIKKIVLQQLQGGLCNELDSFSCEIKLFESAF